MKICILLFIIYLMSFFFFSSFAAENIQESPREVFKSQRIEQGNLIFEQAKKYFDEKMFKSCIEKALDFQILFPKHPLKLSNLKLLSQAYLMDEQWEKSIQTDLKIYREFSTIEDGINSYLEAARKLIRIGNTEEGKQILEKIKTQMYSQKLAKDAEIELNQLKILEMKIE
ncbi:MAG: hypothetical protein N3A69_11995 [Leptospiraceae bacterium]|nr:hypothetical protein [Leptospiraceae bacterium]